MTDDRNAGISQRPPENPDHKLNMTAEVDHYHISMEPESVRSRRRLSVPINRGKIWHQRIWLTLRRQPERAEACW